MHVFSRLLTFPSSGFKKEIINILYMNQKLSRHDHICMKSGVSDMTGYSSLKEAGRFFVFFERFIKKVTFYSP